MKRGPIADVLMGVVFLCFPGLALAAKDSADGVAKTNGSTTAAAAPHLRTAPPSVDPRAILRRVLKANAPWLGRQTHPHSYKILTEWPVDKDQHVPEAWEAIVEYAGPDRLSVRSGSVPCDEERFPPYSGRLEGTYYEQQLAWLQGVCFCGPLHEIAHNAAYPYPVQLVAEERLDGVDAQVLHVRGASTADEETVLLRQNEERLWSFDLAAKASGPQCVYEFTPVECAENGRKRIGVQMKYLLGFASNWAGLAAASSGTPSTLRWGGFVITATTCAYGGKSQPVLVTKPDPDCNDMSPLSRIEIDGEDGATTRLDVYNIPGDEAQDVFVKKLAKGTRRLRMGEGWALDPQRLARIKKEVYACPHFGPDNLQRLGLTCGSTIGTRSAGNSTAADVDQVWVEKMTGRLLREEGFREGKCCFTIQYGDYQRISDTAAVPRHVVATMFDPSPESTSTGGRNRREMYPDVYDMQFAMHGGKVWLLERLTRYAGENRRPVATATVRDVKCAGIGR
jgi:hypothetical protein